MCQKSSPPGGLHATTHSGCHALHCQGLNTTSAWDITSKQS